MTLDEFLSWTAVWKLCILIIVAGIMFAPLSRRKL